MKVVYIVFTVLVAIAAMVFALQNSAPITVQLFAWRVSGSLSLLLVATLAIGCFLGMLIMVPSVWKRGRLAAGLKKRIRHFEKQAAGAAEAVAAPKDEPQAEIPADAARPEGEAAAKKG
ncbi:LapA family protein [bacterium]|nr:LapA family protein [bacterium]